MKTRCRWVPEGDELYTEYHDKEWGVPVRDDQKLFEFLVLESAQAGLSWITILRKRENYRIAFADFDPAKVAKFNEKKIASLLKNEGIIRNEAKIRAAVNNAQRFLEVQKEFGSFSNYIWAFVNYKPVDNKQDGKKRIPATTKISEDLAKDLKKRGFKFLGATTVYAHLQATGMVNDHLVTCFCYKKVKSAKA